MTKRNQEISSGANSNKKNPTIANEAQIVITYLYNFFTLSYCLAP